MSLLVLDGMLSLSSVDSPCRLRHQNVPTIVILISSMFDVLGLGGWELFEVLVLNFSAPIVINTVIRTTIPKIMPMVRTSSSSFYGII